MRREAHAEKEKEEEEKKEDRRRPISPHNHFYKHNDERNVEKRERDLIAAETGMPVRVRFLTRHELPPKLYNEKSTHRLRTR